MILIKLIFFFSSRRRHTRWPRDWSSDVCSSDLGRTPACDDGPVRSGIIFRAAASRGYAVGSWEIGRASCRERVKGSEDGEEIKEADSQVTKVAEENTIKKREKNGGDQTAIATLN